jgi:hypothetical protein
MKFENKLEATVVYFKANLFRGNEENHEILSQNKQNLGQNVNKQHQEHKTETLTHTPKRETKRTFRNKKSEYLKGKINKLEINNKNKNIRDFYRGTNEFKKGYQPKINIIKDENGNLLAHPQNVFNRWKHSFHQVLNVHGVHDVRQMDIHTAEPLVP